MCLGIEDRGIGLNNKENFIKLKIAFDEDEEDEEYYSASF